MSLTLKKIIEGVPSLGSYSGVLHEIEAVLEDPSSTLAHVGAIIEKDPDLTARLLRLGNSSFFGFPSRIDTVSETISLIGLQQVQDLIAVSSVIELFDGVPPELVTMESFWKHSLACGMAARLLALAKRIPKADKFFVAGLLHDIGRMVLYTRAPTEAKEIFKGCASGTVLMRDAEVAVLGFDHAEIGEALLAAWNYPANLVDMVRHHHCPLSAGTYQMESSLIHVADYLVHAMELGVSGERMVPPLNPKAWERLALGMDVIESVMTGVDAQLVDVERAFLARVAVKA